MQIIQSFCEREKLFDNRFWSLFRQMSQLEHGSQMRKFCMKTREPFFARRRSSSFDQHYNHEKTKKSLSVYPNEFIPKTSYLLLLNITWRIALTIALSYFYFRAITVNEISLIMTANKFVNGRTKEWRIIYKKEMVK